MRIRKNLAVSIFSLILALEGTLPGSVNWGAAPASASVGILRQSQIATLPPPVIGVAKNATTVGREVTIDFYLENLGGQELLNVSLTDDLDAVFGIGNYTLLLPPTFIDNPGTLALNSSYDGSSATELIASGSLTIGDTARIRILVEVTTITDQGGGLGIYSNQATAQAVDAGMTPTTDLSDNGTDPDPSDNNIANESGENDPTPIDLTQNPVLGAAKKATLNGTEVTLDFYLENLGNRDLENLSLPDNLDAVFGAGNYSILSGPTLINDPGTITVNTGFNGSGDTQLIASGSLAAELSASIRVVVDVTNVTDRGAGLGVYSNQVTASGTSPAGKLASDVSDAGEDPDSSGNNFPGDPAENDPTVFVIGEEPIIGAAKTATVNGSEVTLDLYLENLGNAPLTALSLTEDLDAVFGPGNYVLSSPPVLIDDPATIVLNPNYDGSSDTALIEPAAGDGGVHGEEEGEDSSLAIGDTAQIRLIATVTNLSDQGFGFGNYRNQVAVAAESSSGAVASDLSDDGTDPDPNGNSDPTETGENDPTDFTLAEAPVIGLAKEVDIFSITNANVDVGGVHSNQQGRRIAITWYVENLGNVELTNVSLGDDLDAVFGAGNYGTLTAANFPEVILSGAGAVNRNTNYNGSTDTEVFLAGSTLSPGDLAVIRTELLLITETDQGFGLGVYSNQATAAATGPSAGMTSDLSDSGDLTDANGNGDPTEGGENDPTNFAVGAFIGAAKTASVLGNEVTIDVYLETFGTVGLSNISVLESLDAVFGAGNYFLSSPPSLIDDPGTLTVNGSFDGSADEELVAPGGSLAIGDTAQIRFVVTVQTLTNRGIGLGDFSNQVTAAGQRPDGGFVFDLSDNGTDPDPSGDGDPSSLAGNEDDPTPISIGADAVVGAAKTASSSGNQITFNLYLENLGSQSSSDLTFLDDFDAVFGAGNYTIASAPAFIDDPGTIVLNPTFDGSSDTNLFAAGSSLAAGDTAQISLMVDVDTVTNQGLGEGVYSNQATVTGTDSAGFLVSDLSDSGTDPDPIANNDPTDAMENDPTVFLVGDATLGAALHSFVNGTVITYDYYLENLGDVAITGIGITHSLLSVFGFGNYTVSLAPSLLEGPASIIVNPSYDGLFSPTLVTGGSLAPGEKARIRLAINVTNVTNQGNGFGVYPTQFTLTGMSPDGSSVSDLSDDGIITDPNGNGDPTEAGENDTTLSVIGEESIVGVAKDATLNGLQVTFDFYIENFGNVTLSNLSLEEDLDSVFGAGNYTISGAPTFIDDPGTITLNGAYNGGADIELFAGGSTLAPADTAQVRLVVDIDAIFGVGNFENQVVVFGNGPSSTVAQDLSDDATDPDSNNNNNPADAPEGDPTLFQVNNPVIGAAKTASVIGALVTFDYYLENLGNLPLSAVRLSDDLDTVFGVGNYTVIDAPSYVSQPRNLLLNPNFDGASNPEIVSGGSISIGILEQIQITVRVDQVTDPGGGFGMYSNQATVEAEDPVATLVADLSDSGTDPDPNGNANPGEAGEDDPTSFTLLVDFGDAPNAYPTLLASDGARHTVGGPLFLGAAVDGEADGQPTAISNGDDTAGGDDEDGVTFLPIPGTSVSDLVPGQTASLEVTSSIGDALLNAWVDFNLDGDWTDPGEQVFSDEGLVAGVNSLSFPVPVLAQSGTTHARFRVDSMGGLSPTGSAIDGEVEDYGVTILESDFGDAPDPTYPTLIANGGPLHAIPSGGATLFLGASIDADADGLPDADALGDDLDGIDDEDGVTFPNTLILGSATSVLVSSSLAGELDYFFDFNLDGAFDSGPEEIFAFSHPGGGAVAVPVNIPATATLGTSFARFRLSSLGGLSPGGFAADGEVEDYAVQIEGVTPSIVCPADVTLSNDSGNCFAQVAFAPVAQGIPTPTVECRIGSTSISSPYDFPVGTTVVDCTAENQVGVATCSFTVTVTDDENPVAVCQPLLVSLDAVGAATITAASVDGGSSDNCGIAAMVVEPTTFACADGGINAVTLTVMDLHGNIGFCTTTVEVVDDTAPMVTLPTIDPIVADGTDAVVPDYTGLVTVLDNCTLVGDIALNQAPAPGSRVPLGTADIVITATDQAGNVNSASRSVPVIAPSPTPSPTITPGGPTLTFTPTITPGGPTLTPTPTFTPGGPTFTPTATITPGGPTLTPTSTATPTLTETSVAVACDSGYYILDSFGGRHRVGNPPNIVGPVYFGNDIARDLEAAYCDINQASDLVVLDGYGAVHFVANGVCDIPQDFYFGDEAETFPQGRAVDLQLTADSAGLWVLTDYGEIFRAGSAGTTPLGVGQIGVLGFDVPTMRDPGTINLTPNGTSLRAVSFFALDEDQDSQAEGYVILDSMGGQLRYESNGDPVVSGSRASQPANDPEHLLDPASYVWPFFPGLDIARDVELHPTQTGVVILDGWDGIHPVPVNDPTNPVFFARNESAPGVPAQTVGMPYIVLGFDDPTTTGAGEDEGDGSLFGIDAESIFTDLEFSAGCPDGGLYTLDKFGGVFVLGEARIDDNDPSPAFGDSPYFFPFLYAEAMEVFGVEETGLNP